MTATDAFLHSVMPDLAEDQAEETQRILNPATNPAAALNPPAVPETPTTGSQPAYEAPRAAQTPSGARITNQAEKAGYGPAEGVETPRPIGGLAYKGKAATLPARPARNPNAQPSRVHEFITTYDPFARDFNDLADINHASIEIVRAMIAVERIYDELATMERHLTADYEQLHDRAIVEVSGASEKTRMAFADIQVEGLRMDVMDIRAEKDRADRTQKLLARHLDALNAIGNNFRAQIRVN